MTQRRILYVEDNPNNMRLIRRIVQAKGHDLLEAADGASGWDVAYSERPDLIFMDLLIPGIDGFELTRKIKSTPELCHIPIVMLTAHGNLQTERRAQEAGCDGFLHKPADIRQIQKVLRQFLGAPVAMAII